MPVTIEIFRPGTHRDISGRELTFSEADVQATAAAYDPALHEAPACVGHPQHDAPAYAWATACRFADGGLVADVDQIDPEFAEMVKAGRFKKISAAFYPPNSPANPKPGTYYLRHIAFLGAQPPAVKGLKPVAFAEGDDIVAFADWDKLDIVSILRGLREYILEKDGAEVADRIIPAYALNTIQNSAAQPDPEPDADDPPSPGFSEANLPPELAETAKRLEAEKAALAAERAAFAEQQTASRKAEDAQFIAAMVRAGRLTPAQRDGAALFLEAISGAGVVAFGEGGAGVQVSSRDWFKNFVGNAPMQVTFGEVAVPQDLQRTASAYLPPPGCQVDPDRAELHLQALAYQEAHQGISYIAAVKAVSKE